MTQAWVMGGLLLVTLSGGLRGSEAPPLAVSEAITYQNDRVESAPWSVHIAKIPWNDPAYEIRSTLARGTVLGLARISDQARAIRPGEGTPVVGVNGDFYARDDQYAGDPRGLQIVQGDLVSGPTELEGFCAFWIDATGHPRTGDVESRFSVTLPGAKPRKFGLNEERRPSAMVLFTPTMGRSTRTVGGIELILESVGKGPWLPLQVGEGYTARVREVRAIGNTPLSKDIMVLSIGPRLAANLPSVPVGSELTFSTGTEPDLRGTRNAIGGGAIITRGGKAQKIERPSNPGSLNSYSINSMFERHPRAAVGWNSTHVFLVEVDGRQRGLSVGMTLAELGRYMARLGCEEAINLDGGGSATFWHQGQVVNSPCDGTERGVANGLIAIRKGGR